MIPKSLRSILISQLVVSPAAQVIDAEQIMPYLRFLFGRAIRAFLAQKQDCHRVPRANCLRLC